MDKVAKNLLLNNVNVLKAQIKKSEKQIDNPALVTSILNELDFFVENLVD